MLRTSINVFPFPRSRWKLQQSFRQQSILCQFAVLLAVDLTAFTLYMQHNDIDYM